MIPFGWKFRAGFVKHSDHSFDNHKFRDRLNPHLVASFDEQPGEVEADEARASHHEDLLRLTAGTHGHAGTAPGGGPGSRILDLDKGVFDIVHRNEVTWTHSPLLCILDGKPGDVLAEVWFLAIHVTLWTETSAAAVLDQPSQIAAVQGLILRSFNLGGNCAMQHLLSKAHTTGVKSTINDVILAIIFLQSTKGKKVESHGYVRALSLCEAAGKQALLKITADSQYEPCCGIHHHIPSA